MTELVFSLIYELGMLDEKIKNDNNLDINTSEYNQSNRLILHKVLITILILEKLTSEFHVHICNCMQIDIMKFIKKIL